MKKNKESTISKLSRWLPKKRSRKVENAINFAIYSIAVICILTGLFLGYRVWLVGFNNAALNLSLLVLCLATASGLLIYRHHIKNSLLQLLFKNRAKISQQVAKRVARKGLNKSREWVIKGIQDGVETAQDLVEEIHFGKEIHFVEEIHFGKEIDFGKEKHFSGKLRFDDGIHIVKGIDAGEGSSSQGQKKRKVKPKSPGMQVHSLGKVTKKGSLLLAFPPQQPLSQPRCAPLVDVPSG